MLKSIAIQKSISDNDERVGWPDVQFWTGLSSFWAIFKKSSAWSPLWVFVKFEIYRKISFGPPFDFLSCPVLNLIGPGHPTRESETKCWKSRKNKSKLNLILKSFTWKRNTSWKMSQTIEFRESFVYATQWSHIFHRRRSFAHCLDNEMSQKYTRLSWK
jgi:hypothetical protein